MLMDAQWAMLEPLIEACRPKGKTPPQDLRRTITAILWRHQNGAKWRAIPADLGPWSRAAQTFIRWARLGVWEKLLLLAQERGVQLGMTFLDGTSIRAHQKAAGAARKGDLQLSGTNVRRWAARVGAMEPKLARLPTGWDGRWPSFSLPGRLMNSRRPSRSSTACPVCPSGWWLTGGSAVTPSASISGSVVPVRRSRPNKTKPQWPVRSGFITIATTWSGSGRGSRSGGQLRPATRRLPPASWASSASLPLSIGSSPNRP
jgi:transposase